MGEHLEIAVKRNIGYDLLEYYAGVLSFSSDKVNVTVL